MNISTNFNLTPLHTFGMETYTAAYTRLTQMEELNELKALKEQYGNILILGGGSNLMFAQDYKGIVVHNLLKGIKVIDENDKYVNIQVASGEIWHEFVLLAIEKNWGGIENLSLIPGTVGAAPIQNIGAYGVEVKSVVQEVYAYDIEAQKEIQFSNSECQFGYRYSIFKHPLTKDKYFITSVIFRLEKSPTSFHTKYGDVQKTLDEMGVKTLTIKSVSDAVIKIRQSKLPDPKVIKNAGSFFKNPLTSRFIVNKLLERFPDMPYYEVENNLIKIPAAWLIEKCGLKGARVGDIGNHDKQALVVVNYGNAKGKDAFLYIKDIQNTVQQTFGVLLRPEVNIISD
ncbi:MAG: UDP-N-acetylmuramate dehydrogenase [Chitinophagales bacterium]|nr:UDP-N-acetylmuramate dehydrogenase [Chitinophagales bacterium]